MAVALVKDLCVMGPAARLDDGQGGKGALRGGEMLIEDRPACEEACDVRHTFREARACHIPRQPVHEDVQYELAPQRAVPETNWCADRIGGVARRCEGGCLRKAEMAERPFAKVCGGGCRILACKAQLLQVLRPRNGEDDLRACGHVNAYRAAHLLCALELEREIALHSVHEHLCMPYLLNECTLVREKTALDIGTDPVLCTAFGQGQREVLADEGIGDELEVISCREGRPCLDHRCTHTKPHCGRETAEPLRAAALQEVCGNLGSEVQPVGVAMHCEGIDGAIQLCIDRCEEFPDLVVHGTAGIGTFRAYARRLCLCVMQEIVRREDIRTLALGRSRPIGGKYGEEVVVKRTSLRTRQEIVKECGGMRVIAPEYREIVLHCEIHSLVSVFHQRFTPSAST